jgi:hypothetical protein
MCQQKIPRQFGYTFHSADLTRVAALRPQLQLSLHLGLYLWLPDPEGSHKSQPVWWGALGWWNFGELPSGGVREDINSESGLSYKVLHLAGV